MLAYGIPLAKVDGTSEKDLADKYGIVGWPTMKVFRKGRIFEYKGPREHSGIVEHMKDLARPPSKIINTVGEFKNGLDRSDTTVLGFFTNKSSLYEEYMEVAQHLRGILTFMHTFSDEVLAHHGGNPNTIVVHQPEIFHSEHEPSSYEFSQVKIGSVNNTFLYSRLIPVL